LSAEQQSGRSHALVVDNWKRTRDRAYEGQYLRNNRNTVITWQGDADGGIPAEAAGTGNFLAEISRE